MISCKWSGIKHTLSTKGCLPTMASSTCGCVVESAKCKELTFWSAKKSIRDTKIGIFVFEHPNYTRLSCKLSGYLLSMIVITVL